MKMQTLRKKTSPLKYKNETTRFLGDGVSFKAKLIGILEVSEARGDRMCQEALSDLKMAIRAAGEHKQRITINIAIDGLRLRDEKTGDSLYHHPVHKISFIAQDMTDSRAFGYIFGSPDTGHRFFGIKTDKAASQVVITMRDLFQVVFALKKKEIELAKQHLDKSRFIASSPFTDTLLSTTKTTTQEVSKTATESKTTSNAENRMEGTAVADLVDLELELNSLQQGINQMQRITPSENFASKDDPFGDSFINYTKPMLPPPPSSGKEKSRRSETNSVPSPLNISDSFSETPPYNKNKKNTFSQQSVESYKIFPADWATETSRKEEEKKKDEAHEASKKEILSHFDVFVELDPLGTGKVKPYVDKKLFFQELKNPPKKVLKDMVAQEKRSPEKLFPNEFGMDSFSEDPFVVEDPFPQVEFTRTDSFKTQPSDMPFNVTPNFPDANLQWSQRILFPQNPAQNFKKFDEERKLHQPYDNLEQEEIAPEPPPKPGTMPLETPPMLPPKKPEISPKKRLEQISFETFNISPLDQSAKKDEKRYEALSNFATLEVGSSKAEIVSTSPKAQIFEDSCQILLPPPQRLTKRTPSQEAPSKSKETLNISSLESLNVNLSELTISDLNELTSKLNIPASELNNMTLAQLTNYITNFVKFKTSVENTVDANTTPSFVADFDANFSEENVSESKPPSDDRYAVFRELINEEIKQVVTSAKDEVEVVEEKPTQNEPQETKPQPSGISANDKYAALREIVEKELKLNNEEEKQTPENKWDDLEAPDDSNVSFADEKTCETSKSESELKSVETKDVKNGDSVKSPMLPSNSSVVEGSSLQNNFRPQSESLSDIASGSSPEMANSCSNSEVRKSMQDTSGENWVVFEQEAAKPSVKGKPSQNEEGVSPWSSDSKEFGNGSPQEWQCVVDSENGGDSKPRQGWEEWWDESEQVKGHYPNVYASKHGGYGTGKRRKHASHFCDGQAAGQSSSSRDVSPWEDEPRGDTRCKKYTRRHSLEKHRDRRQPNEWDDDEDYDYSEERARFHRSAREKWEHDRKFYATEFSNWSGDWSDEKRHRHRREGDRERWCCPDSSSRYIGGRYFPPTTDGHPGHWFDRKFENRYYSRESQESSWEEDYLNEEEEVPSPHYVTTKRVNKRPSSASEMDRKTGEIRLRHYFQPGGSDGERDRRFKPGRRSRSRDSQCSEPLHRRKAEMSRNIHRNKQFYPQQFENNFSDVMSKPKLDNSKIDGAKFDTMRISSKKQMKQSLDKGLVHTLPRKSSQSTSSFENDFVVEHRSAEHEPDTSEPENDSPIVDKKFAKSYGFGKDQGNNPAHSEECTPRASLARRMHLEKARAQGDEDFFQEGGPDLFKMLGQSHDELENKQVRCAEEAKMKAFRQAMANNGQGNFHIKKSESVNIFACESDPFDDDFFSENANYDGKHARENRC